MTCARNALLSVVALALLSGGPAAADTRTYPASTAEIRNPERGFWRFAADDFAKVTKGDLAYVRSGGMTLAYGVVRLDDFRSRPLTDKLLASLERAFALTRESGLKVILRFAYNYPADEHEYRNAKDAPLDVALTHIRQLKPVVAANADVIAVLQAGFIGAWGEGHASSNGLTKPEAKAAIRDALLDALPDGRMLQWRYPGDVIDWEPEPPPAGALARIGLHNDCFMSSNTDVGTYSSNGRLRERQRAYASALSRATFYSGETCAVGSGSERMSCAAILAEGPQFHLSALNRDYNAKFMKRWKEEGCYDEVSRSMGHRLALRRAEAPDAAKAGATARVVVTVANEGWVRLYNPRDFQLVATHHRSGRSFTITTAGDIRDVEPERAKPNSFEFLWQIPADAPAGDYDLAVALPDAAPSLADDPRYAVRPANGSGADYGWDAETGRYRLGLAITVSAD